MTDVDKIVTTMANLGELIALSMPNSLDRYCLVSRAVEAVGEQHLFAVFQLSQLGERFALFRQRIRIFLVTIQILFFILMQ